MGLFGGGGLGKGLQTAAMGGGGLGFFMGGGDEQSDALNRLIAQMQAQQAASNVKAEGYGAQGLRTLLGDYDSAIGNVARTGAASRSAAIGAGRRAGAAGQQSLAGRGLYNTSALNAASAMNTGATSQALANIDAQIAQAKGGLQGQRGQAAQAGYNNLAQLSQQYGKDRLMPLQLAFQQTASQPTDWDRMMQLFQAGGQIAGLGMGGGFG